MRVGGGGLDVAESKFDSLGKLNAELEIIIISYRDIVSCLMQLGCIKCY